MRGDKNIFIHVELFLEEVLTYLLTSELQPVCQVLAHPHSVFSFLVHEALDPSWVDGQGPLGGAREAQRPTLLRATEALPRKGAG